MGTFACYLRMEVPHLFNSCPALLFTSKACTFETHSDCCLKKTILGDFKLHLYSDMGLCNSLQAGYFSLEAACRIHCRAYPFVTLVPH